MNDKKNTKKPESKIAEKTESSSLPKNNINNNINNNNIENSSSLSEEKIKVLVRIKPNNSNEPALEPFHISENKHIQIQTNIFEVDRVYKDISQQKMFENAGLEMAQSALLGINCCLFTYGQTNSGKTYTMIGGSDFLMQKEKNFNNNFKLSTAGILPRTLKYFFDEIDNNENTQYDLECSFFEIYNEKLQDLLDKSIIKEIRICGKKKKGK